MNFLSHSGCYIFALLFPFFIFASPDDDKLKMVKDLDFIQNAFKAQYAPLEWKENYFEWNLDEEVENSKNKILEMPYISVKDYQKIVKNLFNSIQDYHVDVVFYSTESATLPFKIKGADGRYFFTYVDRSKLSPLVYPIKEGDELISFNGKPIADVVLEFKQQEIGKGDNLTSQALAEIGFTCRSGAEGNHVPKGPVMLSVRHRNAAKINSYQLIWDYTPESIKNIFQVNNIPNDRSHKLFVTSHLKKEENRIQLPLNQHPVFKKMMLASHYFKADDPRRSYEDIGARQSYIPVLGKKVWETSYSCPFYAYLFENENQRKIGFIRIPHYLNSGNEVAEFKAIIAFLQENSEALIIDQINNPGGSLFYLYALASMLTDQPLYAPRHRMSITQKEVAFALEVLPLLEAVKSDRDAEEVLGDVFEGNPVTYQTAQFFLNYFRFIVDEWNAGHTFTSPTYLWGIDYIHPHPEVRYTKPILLIINSLDFSGGDFFPAIMQDNKRVTVFGTRTAGAGGFVLKAEYPNIFGIEYFHYTASLAERENSNFIENIGITPDILYEHTVDDLQNNYREYASKIIESVETLLK